VKKPVIRIRLADQAGSFFSFSNRINVYSK
jgi:RPA family protein